MAKVRSVSVVTSALARLFTTARKSLCLRDTSIVRHAPHLHKCGSVGRQVVQADAVGTVVVGFAPFTVQTRLQSLAAV